MNEISDQMSIIQQPEYAKVYNRIRGSLAFSAFWNLLDESQKFTLNNDKNIEIAYADYKIAGAWIHLFGGSIPEAIISVGYFLGFLNEQIRDHLLKQLGAKFINPQNATKPVFNAGLGELLYQEILILKLRGHSTPSGSYRILEAFQDDNWESTIDNPLKEHARDLEASIRNLNNNQKTINFSYYGYGHTISWDFSKKT